MPFSLIPRGVYDRVSDISPEALAERGIKLVLADLDNTLVPYQVSEPTQELFDWKKQLNDNGITLFLLSNSRKPTRPGDFAGKLGIPFIGHAGKPIRLAGNPGRYLRYAGETPFRLLGARRPFI